MNKPTITLTRKGPEEDGWKIFFNGVDYSPDWMPWEFVARVAKSFKWMLPYEYWIADGNGNYGYLKP